MERRPAVMRFFAWKENFAKADALIVENRPLPMFLCRVLASRGIKDSASAETFFELYPTAVRPMELHDMEKAVTIVRRAIDEERKFLSLATMTAMGSPPRCCCMSTWRAKVLMCAITSRNGWMRAMVFP